MADKHDTNPDMGAAFTGLIGGAIFIGAILYAIVVWTNKQFEGHGAEKKAAVVTVSAPVA
ncbi:MAG: hypothetical protein ACK6DP_17880 [Gemmatimonas sp.]|jgi:hypothetical protein|uniref:hypothetical protein n=1 Tax=Gemmatimonas sp. TaxID=1962908 RepID=UPI00391F62CB|nr:hypothetical protein [Gemmatimonadota bacterium]